MNVRELRYGHDYENGPRAVFHLLPETTRDAMRCNAMRCNAMRCAHSFPVRTDLPSLPHLGTCACTPSCTHGRSAIRHWKLKWKRRQVIKCNAKPPPCFTPPLVPIPNRASMRGPRLFHTRTVSGPSPTSILTSSHRRADLVSRPYVLRAPCCRRASLMVAMPGRPAQSPAAGQTRSSRGVPKRHYSAPLPCRRTEAPLVPDERREKSLQPLFH